MEPVSTHLVGEYDYRLVSLSVVIAILSSYAALDLGGRVTAARGQARAAWLVGGAAAMGLGIWSMHYIGMLAYTLPVEVTYDWPTVAVSLLAATIASGVALFVVSRPTMNRLRLIAGGVAMGSGIATMHYVGMEAMRLPAMCHYSQPIVVLSVVLAMLISMVALWLTFRLREEGAAAYCRKLLSAVTMGAAIPVMHYTGMAAVHYVPMAGGHDLKHAVEVSELGIASILLFTLAVLGAAIVTSLIDRRFSSQALALSLSEQRQRQLVAELAERNHNLEISNEQFMKSSLESNIQQHMIQVAEAASGMSLWDWDLATGQAICGEQWFVIHRIEDKVNPVTLATWLDAIHPDDRRGATDAVEHTMSHDSPYCFDYRVVNQDGGVRWLNSRGKLWRDEQGVPIRMVGASMDITERVEGQRFLAEHAKKMEELVSQRDVQAQSLAETVRHLREANAEVERATQAKSDFLAHMSHEVRTPMNGVIGMADLLMRTELSAEQSDFATTIRSSGAALLAVINDILDFSKIDAKKLQIECVRFNIRLLAEECVDLLSELAAGKGVELQLELDPDLPAFLLGDPGRLRQVLLNLAGNAIKFTPVGTVYVRLLATFATAETVSVQVLVKDTGIGMTAETQDRLFQPFSQADSSTTRRFGGTGLGLIICKNLVELMGGTIGVDSIPGEGSTFFLTLPLSIASDQGAEAACSLALSGYQVAGYAPAAADRAILTGYLRGVGMRVDWLEAASELIGWEFPARHDGNYALLLAVNSVDEEALAVVAEIRERRGAPPPLIVVTSRRAAHDQIAIDQVPHAVLLRKPLRESVFRAGLQQLLLAHDSVAAPVPTAVEGPGSRGRVLVAEDNPVNQRVARGMLQRLGYEVNIVPNGLLALEAVCAGRFDAVLMDAHMPVMDGATATRNIRRTAGCGRLPIIALTASALATDREFLLASGMNDYLTKPVRLDELQRTLSRWIANDNACVDSPALV